MGEYAMTLFAGFFFRVFYGYSVGYLCIGELGIQNMIPGILSINAMAQQSITLRVPEHFHALGAHSSKEIYVFFVISLPQIKWI